MAIDADLSFTIENLKESGAITIAIVRQQVGQTVDQMEQNALQLLKESLLNEFFRPAMSNVTSPTQVIGTANQMIAGTAAMSQGVAANPRAGQPATGTRVELGFQLQYKKEEELRTATYDYNVIAPETRTHAPNGFFSALLTDTQRAEQIREIDLDDDFFKVLVVDISTTADFERLDIASIVVELQYGGTVDAPRQTGTAVLTKADQEHRYFQAFIDHDDASYRYRVSYKFGSSDTIAAQRQEITTPWRTSTGRALVVHPPEDVAMLHVHVAPGVVDWDVVDQIETTLGYDDPANQFRTSRSFVVAQNSPVQDWVVRLTDPARAGYTAAYLWHLKDHSEIPGPVTEEARAHLPVADPFVDRLPIRIQPLVDPTNVSRVDVELSYVDGAHHFEVHKNVGVSGPDFVPVTETIPMIDPSHREYTYQATLIKKNGQAELQQAITTDALSILVTEGGLYFDVTITLLGDMAAAGIQAIQVDLRAEPLEGAQQKLESKLFQPGASAQSTARLLLRADRGQQFEYRTVAFVADRGPIESSWRQQQNANLVLQPARLLTP